LIASSQACNDRYGEIRMDRLRRNSSPIKEERVMNKATSTLIAAVAALTLSGGAYAQSNNTLATPTTVSPAAAATSGYGTPGGTNSDSGTGAGSPNSGLPNSTNPNSTNNSATSLTNAPGSHNTLATPTTISPAAQ
jgi:hypothetical protein